MPIYAYRCASCGHARDVLQKMSDPVLTVCPACGADAFSKQLTAAGFQLKGSGWYVTDFRNGSGAGKAAPTAPTAGGEASAAGGDAPAAAPPAASAPAAPASGGSASASPAAPASGGCGSSCACH